VSDTFHRFRSEKILVYADKLRDIAAGGFPYPIDWHIYPSNVCNHKCTWCMFRQNTPDGAEGEQFKYRVKLTKTVLLKAVEDAARTGAKLVHFSGGGEPLLNKHTVEAMRLANDLGLEVALSTNGRLLTPEIAALVHNIRVSLNAGTKQQHWKTNHGSDERDPGDWEVILENIRHCVPYAKRDFGLGFVVDHENWQDIYPFCAVAAETGAHFVHIRPAFYYEAEKDATVRSAMPHAVIECERAKREFSEKVKVFSITEKFDGYWTPRSYSKCHAVKTGIVLCATGDFAVCQDRTDLRFGSGYAIGKTFEDIWGSREHKMLLNSICAGNELDKCPRCVWNSRNSIIQEVFIEDGMRLNLV
jgi:cyclic pyranopterin phosphate synthase